MNETGLEQELAQLQNVYTLLTEFLVNYSFQLVGALLIFLLGLWLAGKVAKMVEHQFEKHHIDPTLSHFSTNVIRLLIVVMVAIVALGKLGISVTPMIAAIGAVSLGAGLAVQGMLSNYAAGLTIIVTRPFTVGNTITVRGVTGVVKDVRLGLTLLSNEEGEQISIPNKHIVGEILYNSFGNRLVESHFNLAFDANPEHAIEVITAVLKQQPAVAQDQAMQVGINGFSSAGIELGLRFWIPSASYYQDKYKINLAVWQALLSAGVSIPAPARNIHIVEDTRRQ
ncbi:mechanosensitive ion channel family protein [Shewanella cyperi]|uniref:Small-conductance mechanosensitive channel n=1 Tax=Shewanella cyperi TaxID=2814292 RepID=A0A974XL59_9GAMM|nr:mechanosensitive ion channel family protein [Shewanella cyperi]QSX30430.1 mechanosensitive ion channel family protein [Shewanella cyperi]